MTYHTRVQASPFGVVVLVGSLGSHDVMRSVLSRLPRAFPVPLVVLRHMRKCGPSVLATVLSRWSALPLDWAAHGSSLRSGSVLVAPPGVHLVLRRTVVAFARTRAPINYALPSADPLLHSAATVFGPRALAIIMSGRLTDGLAGAAAVHDAGGVVVAQDPATAEAIGMPGGVIERQAASLVLSPAAIAPALVSLTMVPGAAARLGWHSAA